MIIKHWLPTPSTSHRLLVRNLPPFGYNDWKVQNGRQGVRLDRLLLFGKVLQHLHLIAVQDSCLTLNVYDACHLKKACVCFSKINNNRNRQLFLRMIRRFVIKRVTSNIYKWTASYPVHSVLSTTVTYNTHENDWKKKKRPTTHGKWKIIIDKHKKVVPFYHYTKKQCSQLLLLCCGGVVVELEHKELRGKFSVSLEKLLERWQTWLIIFCLCLFVFFQKKNDAQFGRPSPTRHLDTK